MSSSERAPAVQVAGQSADSEAWRSSKQGWALLAIPVALAAFQIWWLQHESDQIRYEELAEGIRNPYWFAHRRLYDGVSSNIGWYGLLHWIYSIVGFDLFYGRVVKVFVYFLSLLALADVARRQIGSVAAAILVVTIGLSPTYLFFGRMMTSHGIDLAYAAFWLWIVTRIDFGGDVRDRLRAAAAFAVLMLGCMSMPSLVPYLPALFGAFLWWLWRRSGGSLDTRSISYAAFAAAGFAIPVAAARLYVRGPLFYDPDTRSGLFRGGGYLDWHPSAIAEAAKVVLHDLFRAGDSYYFHLRSVDFGSPLAQIALAATAGWVAYAAVRRPAMRPVIAVASLLLAAGLIIPSLSAKFPGLRRATGALAGLYALYAIALAQAFTRTSERVWLWRLLAAPLLLLPASHVLAQVELVREGGVGRRLATRQWFVTDGGPRESFAHWLDYTEREHSLPSCEAAHGRRIRGCRYAEIFAALDGYRMWNDEPAVPIEIVDPRSRERVTLSVESGKFP